MPPVTRSGRASDIRDQPAYPLAEAARYLGLSSATLRTWVVGRSYSTASGGRKSPPLIKPAASSPPQLSFWNLIEAHVLSGLRTTHGVPVRVVRKALAYAEKELNIERLLLSKQLQTAAGALFLEKYGELIELSASGQIAIQQVFQAHLKRVEWDASQFPVRLYPFMPANAAAASIAIDAQIAFGRPILTSSGIQTSVIADRIDAGESVEEVAADYDLSTAEVEQAIVYERAA